MEKLDLTPFKLAKLRPAEIGFLCGVSRVTAHTWMRKDSPVNPHRLIRERVKVVLSAVTRAVEAKDLPYTGDEPAVRKTPEGYNVRLEVLKLVQSQMAD